jgi:AcrR family transcriptional regulator
MSIAVSQEEPMPAQERTSLAEIVAAGRDLLEATGPSGLTMQAVAERVGVRAPSLYKRVRDRDALLGLIAAATVDELSQRMESSDGTLAGLARSYRSFAHDRPEGFRLMLSAERDAESLARSSAPILRAVEELAGSADVLEGARLVTAWATGFVIMELAGAFRLGGNLETAFEFGIVRLSAALSLPDNA